MASLFHRALIVAFASLGLAGAAPLSGQVFVVGEKTATADIATDFKPTRVELPTDPIGERGRRDLIRTLVAEQGFAHRALPLGGLTLRANGNLTPGGEKYRKMIFEKGQSAAVGDRVMITALVVRSDRIILDLNGGPYEKHRFLSHIEFNGNSVVRPTERPNGARITLLFEREVPDVSGPEVKSLLEPVIDFGVKTSEQAYADTLPQPLRDAIAAHDVLVGMDRRMVLASLGAPESKMRERDQSNGVRYEEWIYGHVPETVRFVRFQGDRVAKVEIAELGKPIQVHDKDEMAGLGTVQNTREVVMGDVHPTPDGGHTPAGAPSLRKPGEAPPASGPGAVQFPTQQSSTADSSSTPQSPHLL